MPSDYVGARSIEELASALTKLSYTPRTEEQRRQQSEAFYRNQLNSALLSAQQQYDTADLALANQLNGLNTAATRQINAQRENTRNAISQAGRQALSRGMQRSSYNLSRMANIQLKGNEAEAQIQQSRTDMENSIAAQRALLASQFAQNRTAAQAAYENSVLSRMLEMEDQDYQRQLAADQFNSNTQLQLYQAQQQDAQRWQQQLQFEAGQGLTREQMAQNQNQFDLNLALQRDELAEKIRQFNEQMAFNRDKLAGAGSGSGSGGSGGSGGPITTGGDNPPPPPVTKRDYDKRTTEYMVSQAKTGAVAANRAVTATQPSVAPANTVTMMTPYELQQLKEKVAASKKTKTTKTTSGMTTKNNRVNAAK